MYDCSTVAEVYKGFDIYKSYRVAGSNYVVYKDGYRFSFMEFYSLIAAKKAIDTYMRSLIETFATTLQR